MSAPVLRLAARALAQRILPERRTGISAYYRDGIAGRIADARWHLAGHPQAACLLELGCGRDLHTALCAAVLEGRRAIAWDVAPLAEPELINFVLAHLGHPLRIRHPDDLAAIGIRYVVAPAADRLDGFDGVMSTAVLEHVPAAALEPLFATLVRRLPPGRAVTAIIDYRDHWSFIEAVPSTAFYAHGDTAWAWLNHRRMHQNRWRHSDFLRLAGRCGLTLAEQRTEPMPDPLPARLAPRWRDHDPDDLRIGVGRMRWLTPAG